MRKPAVRNVRYPDIARRLKLLRLTRGYESQISFTEAYGFNYTQWNNWETGDSRPQPEDVSRLKHTFGVTMDWIYDGDETYILPDLARRLREAANKLDAGSSELPKKPRKSEK